MPRLVHAKLVPSPEGFLKIHLQYEGGFGVIADPQIERRSYP